MNDLLVALPLLIVTGWGVILLLLDLFIPPERKGWTALLAALGIIAALVITILQFGEPKTAFNGMLIYDGFASYLQIVFLITGLMGIAVAYDYIQRMGIERGEYYVLMLFSISGMILMSAAGDLIVIFLALELLSLPLYVLSGFARPNPDSEESAMKYFLLGAFSSSFFVYGVAFVFGATGSTRLVDVFLSIDSNTAGMGLLITGGALILVGLAFKVAAIPFHMWTPDVYHGAPSSVVAFMSVGAKAAGFAALLRVLIEAFPALSINWGVVAWWLASLTMIWGNIAAIRQSNIKRMLAYSSIAHAGYILMALTAAANNEIASSAVSAAVFYLFAYMFANLGAWAVVVTLEKKDGQGLEIRDFAGLSKRHPGLALAMAIFMLSLTGVPPTIGFVGKFTLFTSVVDAGLVWLAVIGILTTLISAFYYLRVVVYMFMQEGEPETRSEVWLNLTVAFTAVATVILGLFPEFVLNIAEGANLLEFLK
jgi:NADH-quinone oxidoreductase subunit N